MAVRNEGPPLPPRNVPATLTKKTVFVGSGRDKTIHPAIVDKLCVLAGPTVSLSSLSLGDKQFLKSICRIATSHWGRPGEVSEAKCTLCQLLHNVFFDKPESQVLELISLRTCEKIEANAHSGSSPVAAARVEPLLRETGLAPVVPYLPPWDEPTVLIGSASVTECIESARLRMLACRPLPDIPPLSSNPKP